MVHKDGLDASFWCVALQVKTFGPNMDGRNTTSWRVPRVVARVAMGIAMMLLVSLVGSGSGYAVEISWCEEIDALRNPLTYAYHKVQRGGLFCLLVPDCCLPTWPFNPLCYVDKLDNISGIPREISTTVTCSNYTYSPGDMVKKYLNLFSNPMNFLPSPTSPLSDIFRQYYEEALTRAQPIPNSYASTLLQLVGKYPFTADDIKLARVIPASDRGAQTIFPGGSKTAITYYNLIIVKDQYLDPNVDFCKGLALLGHELVHVHQYGMMGVDRFWATYLQSCMKGYCSSPYEREAYLVDEKIFYSCNPKGKFTGSCPFLGAIWSDPPYPLTNWDIVSPVLIGWGPGVLTYPTFAADISGDGLSDLIFPFFDSTRGLTVRSLISSGTGTWAQREQVLGWGPKIFEYPPLIGDINGDGKADIVFMFMDDRAQQGYAGLTVRTLISGGNGNWAMAEQNVRWGSGVLEYPALIGDVNGDGRADLVFAYRDNGLKVRTLFSNGNGTWSGQEQYIGWGPAVHNYPKLIGDINGDGKADIVFMYMDTGLAVRTLISRGDGTWASNEQQIGWGPGVLNYGALIGDVNGDGRADLVFPFQDNGLKVRTLFSNGNGTWSGQEQYIGWGSGIHRSPTQAADINADKKLDLIFPFVEADRIVLRSLISKGDGTWFWYGENTGRPGGSIATISNDERLLHNVKVANFGRQKGSDVVFLYPTTQGLVVATILSKF